VLALIPPPGGGGCALAEWPRLLGVDQVSLCADGPPAERVRMLTGGVLARGAARDLELLVQVLAAATVR